MFCTGDLIRLPSQVGLYQMNNQNTIDCFLKTKEPKMGIFMHYENSKECVINVDGQNWLVELQCIRMMGDHNGKINTN